MFVRFWSIVRLNRALVLVILAAGAGLVFVYTTHRSHTVNVVIPNNAVVAVPDRPAYVPPVNQETSEAPATSTTKTPTKPKDIKGDYVLSIETIGVKVPVVINVDGLDEVGYLKALEGGVAHYKGTPTPGNKGNAFIFGHSSYYANKPGSYKTIFKSLGKLKVNDTFSIVHGSTSYTYTVFVSQQTSPNETKWLDDSKDEIVTLSTCWPPGSVDNRWVVQGKRK